MNTIKIDKRTKLDLEQYLYVWFNALPENHDRMKIKVGQPEIIFWVVRPLVTSEIGLFSKPIGGTILAEVSITCSNSVLPVRVDSGDRIIYRIDWSGY